MRYSKVIVLALLFFINKALLSQSFEGILTYKVTFEVNNPAFNDQMKEALFDKMKEEGEYYDSLIITIKNGDYIKEDNSKNKKKIVYRQQENQLFIFTQGSEYVTVIDAQKKTALKDDYPNPKVKKSKTSESLFGKKLKSIKLTWEGLGQEIYYYNADLLPINSNLFQEHNYEFLNTVLSTTKSYPMRVIKSVNQLITIKMTLVDYSEKSLGVNIFQIPKLEKVDTEYAKSVYETSGNQVLRIVN